MVWHLERVQAVLFFAYWHPRMWTTTSIVFLGQMVRRSQIEDYSLPWARTASAVLRRAKHKKDTKWNDVRKAQLWKIVHVQGTGETDQVSARSGSFGSSESNGMKCELTHNA